MTTGDTDEDENDNDGSDEFVCRLSIGKPNCFSMDCRNSFSVESEVESDSEVELNVFTIANFSLNNCRFSLRNNVSSFSRCRSGVISPA